MIIILQKFYWSKIFYLFVIYLTFEALYNIRLNVKNPKKIENYESENVLKPIHKKSPIKFNKYVVISASLISKDNYMFNLPMVCLSWRRVGFEPIVLIVKSSTNMLTNPLTDLTINYLKLFEIKHIFIESPNEYEKLVSMLVRIFAGLISFVADNDLIITSDSDLYPINKQYYDIIQDNESIYAWNAFCCGHFKHQNEYYRMYPISSVGMSKQKWRHVMQLNSTFELNGSLILNQIKKSFDEKIFIKKNHQIKKADQAWYLDQTWLSVNIKEYLKKSKTNIIQVDYTGLRLDRNMPNHKWKKSVAYYFESITDCHSFQSKLFKNWKLLNSLFLNIFNLKTNSLIRNYYLKYRKIIDA